VLPKQEKSLSFLTQEGSSGYVRIQISVKNYRGFEKISDSRAPVPREIFSRYSQLLPTRNWRSFSPNVLINVSWAGLPGCRIHPVSRSATPLFCIHAIPGDYRRPVFNGPGFEITVDGVSKQFGKEQVRSIVLLDVAERQGNLGGVLSTVTTNS